MKYCQLAQCWYTICEYVHTIFRPADFLTAELILLFGKYSVSIRSDWRGDKLSLWLIAELAQSSTKLSLLKLCLRAFRAKSSCRSCLVEWPRWSLLGQPPRVFCLCWGRLMGRDSLEGVWLSRWSQLNACSPDRSCPSSLRGRILLTTPGPNKKFSILYQASEAVSPEGGRIS